MEAQRQADIDSMELEGTEPDALAGVVSADPEAHTYWTPARAERIAEAVAAHKRGESTPWTGVQPPGGDPVPAEGDLDVFGQDEGELFAPHAPEEESLSLDLGGEG